MFIDINMVSIAGMRCNEIVRATAAYGFKRDYQLMFQDVWGFDYNRHSFNRSYSHTISLKNDNVDKNLKEYHGVDLIKIDDISKSKYIEFAVDTINKGNPIDLGIDQAYLPWAKKIRKEAPLRYSGNIMLVGHDLKANVFKCIDIHGSQTFEELPFDSLLQYAFSVDKIKFTVFHKLDIEKNFNLKNYIDITLDRIFHSDSNMFDNINRLSRDIREDFDFQKEIEYTKYTIGNIPTPTWIIFVKDLINIARVRSLYSITLKYISDIYNNDKFNKLSDEFKMVWTKWQVLVSILFKAYYSKDNSKLGSILADRLCELAEDEKKLAKQLEKSTLEIKKSNINNDKEDYAKDHTGNCVEYLNLNHLFNNNAIRLQSNNTMYPNFDGLNNFYEMEKLPIDNEVFDGRCNFKISNQNNDNIVCNGQLITITNEFIQEINFLGSCDSSAFYGKFLIYYENGYIQECVLGFGEWRFKKCELGEKIAYITNRNYFGKVNEEEKGYFFSNYLEINKLNKVVGIELPKCENMHIFAITIIKKAE